MSDIFDDRKKLKQRAKVEADREGLAEATGITNEQILEAFREMGLDREAWRSSTSSPSSRWRGATGQCRRRSAWVSSRWHGREGSWKGRRRTGSYSRGSGTGPTPCSSGGREP